MREEKEIGTMIAAGEVYHQQNGSEIEILRITGDRALVCQTKKTGHTEWVIARGIHQDQAGMVAWRGGDYFGSLAEAEPNF